MRRVHHQGQADGCRVRSVPSGATALINGTEVGQTPFKVKLNRDEVFRLDFAREGFAPQSALLMPSDSTYEQRFLRWGIDYDLGVTTSLVPDELVVQLQPALGQVTAANRYEEMSAQIARADELLAEGKITASDHQVLVRQIAATYHQAY
jgi:hypothetical protein